MPMLSQTRVCNNVAILKQYSSRWSLRADRAACHRCLECISKEVWIGYILQICPVIPVLYVYILQSYSTPSIKHLSRSCFSLSKIFFRDGRSVGFDWQHSRAKLAKSGGASRCTNGSTCPLLTRQDSSGFRVNSEGARPVSNSTRIRPARRHLCQELCTKGNIPKQNMSAVSSYAWPRSISGAFGTVSVWLVQ